MSSDDPKKPDDEEADVGAEAPVEPITLDRYLSKRRPVQKTGWVQIVSMVAMLGALVMIMMYKDSCGRQVSQLLGNVAPGPGSAAPGTAAPGPGSLAPKGVPARPRAPVLPPTLARPSAPPQAPASVPTKAPPKDPKPAK